LFLVTYAQQDAIYFNICNTMSVNPAYASQSQLSIALVTIAMVRAYMAQPPNTNFILLFAIGNRLCISIEYK